MKDYNDNDLVQKNKKIRIKAEVSPLKYDPLSIYESVRLISIDKIHVKTYWKSKEGTIIPARKFSSFYLKQFLPF